MAGEYIHASEERRIRTAVEIGRSVNSRTRHEVRRWANTERDGVSYVNYVYVVLLRFPHHQDPFGLYVGKSHLRPSQRLANHRRGIQANADVQKFGIRLLPTIYQHLNPMRPSEASQIERSLYLSLKASNVGWVSMGHLRPAESAI